MPIQTGMDRYGISMPISREKSQTTSAKTKFSRENKCPKAHNSLKCKNPHKHESQNDSTDIKCTCQGSVVTSSLPLYNIRPRIYKNIKMESYLNHRTSGDITGASYPQVPTWNPDPGDAAKSHKQKGYAWNEVDESDDQQ